MSDGVVRERQRERLGVLTAVVRAQDRRDEVLAVLGSASSDEEAEAGIVELLGLEEPVHAMAVLDMQLRRMTEPERDRTRAEYDELRSALGDGR